MADRTYDFVIVGAGSAGCALANRLTADPSVSVALIEAGGDDSREAIRDPRQYFSLWGTDVDWGYASTPQPRTANRVHPMPRGRVLGGTSSINGMVYLRGARSDYDGWAAGGCPGWEWDAVRSSFEELETWLCPILPDSPNPLTVAMIEAAVEAGFPRNPSFDDGILEGTGWIRSTTANDERRNNYRAFVAPVLDRPNLHVRPETRVLRLAMDGDRAAGVVVQLNGATETIRAAETILCAGAFDSPRLLMLSGIGPVAHLEHLGIAPVADLPVGQNLIDHLLIGTVFTARQPIPRHNVFRNEASAFARSGLRPESGDIKITFVKEMLFAPETDDGLPRFTLVPGITRPRSRGTLRLTSADPAAPLAIDPNYFADPDDMAVMIRAIRYCREIASQDALAEWNAGEHFPGPAVETDDEIAAFVEAHVSTWFHPVGTCRMGIGPDAVVDPTLRVHGIAGLRVADASIMPDIVSVNTQGAATMIGWHAGGFALD
jgi:choline dehydrogenase